MDASENNMKNIRFSKNQSDSDHNFQTANMEEKIKKIKNRKVINNYKNIDTFDTINNPPNVKKEKKKENKNAKKEQIVENFSLLSNLVSNKMIEGNQNIDGTNNGTQVCTPEDITDSTNTDCYEGHDNVSDSKSNKVDWQKDFADAINSAYDSSTGWVQLLAEVLANELSQGKATDRDIELIRHYLSTLIAAIVSVPVSYNWYFIMYYNDYDNLFHLSIKELKEKAAADETNVLKSIMFLFEFALFFPSVLDFFITKMIPTYTSWLNGKMKYMLVYIATFFILKKCIVNIKDFFIALITDTTSNMMVNLMFATVFINFFVSLFSTKISDLISQAMSPIIFLVVNIILRFILVIIISVPIGGILCILYLFIYSLASIFIYSDKGFIETIKNINLHSNTSDPPPTGQSCEEEGIFRKLLRTIIKYLGLFKSNIVMMVIMFIIIYYFFRLKNNLSNSVGLVSGMSFKDSFMYFNFLFGLIILTMLYIGLSDKISEINNANNDK
jgi:hypothetical protein